VTFVVKISEFVDFGVDWSKLLVPL